MFKIRVCVWAMLSLIGIWNIESSNYILGSICILAGISIFTGDIIRVLKE